MIRDLDEHTVFLAKVKHREYSHLRDFIDFGTGANSLKYDNNEHKHMIAGSSTHDVLAKLVCDDVCRPSAYAPYPFCQNFIENQS